MLENIDEGSYKAFSLLAMIDILITSLATFATYVHALISMILPDQSKQARPTTDSLVKKNWNLFLLQSSLLPCPAGQILKGHCYYEGEKKWPGINWFNQNHAHKMPAGS